MKARRVGIRELRQNLSRYLRRVARGERLEVTERGKPIAVLGPLPEALSTIGRLAASGRARAPVGDLIDLPAPSGRPSTSGSDALNEQRGERL